MEITLVDKLRYTIGEVADAFQVNTSLIRFWEKEFPQLQPQKSATGNRFYTKKDIELLKLIYFLVKENGYTLEGAKKHLDNQQAVEKKIALLSRLEFLRKELFALKERIG